MDKILRAQFYRLWRMKSFYVCVAVGAAFAVLGIIIMQAEMGMYKSMVTTQPQLQLTIDNISASIKEGGVGRLAACMGGNLIPILIGIVISLFICMDISSGAIKNAHGFRRSEFYFATLIVTCVLSVIMTLIYMLSSFVAGSIAWGTGTINKDVILNILKLVGIQNLLIVGCASLFVMVAFLIRNSGGTIAVNLGSLIIVSLILTLISPLFEKDFLIDQYWIGDAISFVAKLNITNDDIIRSLIVAGCYIVIPTVIGLFTFQKRDIK